MVLSMVGLSPCQSPIQQRPNISIDVANRPIRAIKTNCMSRQKKLPTNCLYKCPSDGNSPRVFVVSDLHTDYSENLEWVKGLSTLWYQKDVLIVAGDVAETYSNFLRTMSELKKRFGSVFFVPGNHDLWCRREGGRFREYEIYLDGCKSGGRALKISVEVDAYELDSLEKLNALLDACSDLEVETSPKIVEGLGIIPLFSWYHKSFDREKDVTGIRIPSLELACKDFHACKWPTQINGEISLACYFDTLNEKNSDIVEEIRRTACQLITFSHFVPRQELCPEKRMLFYPNLPKIIGSDLLEVRLRSIHGENGSASACHVFGHTHFCWDAMLDGLRYVQAPLAYPRERKRRMNGGEDWLPFCIYHEGFMDGLSNSYWSDYYTKNKREPENIELAPWVARFYAR